MANQGFKIDSCRAFVKLHKLTECRYDNKAHVFYKHYENDGEILPLPLVMKKRSPDHYLNINERCNSLLKAFQRNSQALCLNMQLFGVIGKVNGVDMQRGTVKLDFDKENEEAKIHDPFFGQRVLKDQELHKKISSKRYYGDQQIEQLLQLPRRFVNQLTGSVLISFNDRDKLERQVVDIGLNIKNFTKKQHIPDYVRFVSDPDSIADNQFDEFQHNQHARGAHHVRKHWEYSEECFEAIKEYRERFPDIIDALIKSMKQQNKQVLTLRDLFGGKGRNIDHELEYKQTCRLKEVTHWIEKQPMSHMPFVEMGFDALHEDLIKKLDVHTYEIKEKFQGIKLKCRDYEYLQPNFIFQENFPFWCQPFSDKTVHDYQVGDRVININSTKREFIPFGMRGTVVGHTNDRVIVLFDEQFLGGNNIYGHGEDLKGAYLNPNFLVNLTHKFLQILKKNTELVSQFQEKAAEGTEESKAQQEHREELLMKSSQQQPPAYQNQQQPIQQNYRQQNQNRTYGQNNNQGYGQQQYQQRPQKYQQNQQVQQQPQQKQRQPQYAQKPQQPQIQTPDQQTAQMMYQPKQQPQIVEQKETPQTDAADIGSHRTVQQVQYIAKKTEVTVPITQTQVLMNNDEDEDAGAEYQDLKVLTQQLQATVLQMQNAPEIENAQEQIQHDAQEPSGFVLGEATSQPFVPSFQLDQNPDFQMLMNLMNSAAQQIQQVPIFVADPSAQPVINPTGFNLNTEPFVPFQQIQNQPVNEEQEESQE